MIATLSPTSTFSPRFALRRTRRPRARPPRRRRGGPIADRRGRPVRGRSPCNPAPKRSSSAEVPPQGLAGDDLHVVLTDEAGNTTVKHRPGETEIGNADRQHAARNRQGLEDRHPVATPAKLVSRIQAGGTRSHHGNGGIFRFLNKGRRRKLALPHLPVGGEPLQGRDGDRVVYIAALTGFFARMVAHPPADTRKRHGSLG